jgi:nicotinamidase/pyrazinamidase
MVNYGPATALVVVDVQNDFADPRGALHVPGGEDVVQVVNREVERARAAGALVVYTQDWHPPRTPHFLTEGGPWPVHCVAGSWGAALAPALKVAGPVVRKGTGGEDGYSGFTVRDPETGHERPTELAALLHERGTTRVVVVGLATDYCVKETALDALRTGLSTTVLEEAVRAVDLEAGDGARALDELRRAGAEVLPG